MKNTRFLKTNGAYGAKVGGKIVLTREGAISKYKAFLDNVYNDKNGLDYGGATVLSEVEEDMIKLGFTWEELEEIEIEFLK